MSDIISRSEEAQPINLKSNSNGNLSLLITAGIFFALGFLVAYLIFGSTSSTNDNINLEVALSETLIALTPPATPIPTRVPLEETYVVHNPSLGPDDAPITIVEFSDYQCPYCLRFHTTVLPPLIDHYGDLVRFVYREYPVIGGQSSAAAGVAAQCAFQQGKYWEFTDLIWENQAQDAQDRLPLDNDLFVRLAETVNLDMQAFNECVISDESLTLINIDLEAGKAFNITGTPTFFIEGERLVGAHPLETFIRIIDAERTKKGIEIPAS